MAVWLIMSDPYLLSSKSSSEYSSSSLSMAHGRAVLREVVLWVQMAGSLLRALSSTMGVIKGMGRASRLDYQKSKNTISILKWPIFR